MNLRCPSAPSSRDKGLSFPGLLGTGSRPPMVPAALEQRSLLLRPFLRPPAGWACRALPLRFPLLRPRSVVGTWFRWVALGETVLSQTECRRHLSPLLGQSPPERWPRDHPKVCGQLSKAKVNSKAAACGMSFPAYVSEEEGMLQLAQGLPDLVDV